MIYTVLVVDDSNFFQHRLKEIINEHPELKVIGIATNGQEAIEMADELRPDVISMDYEMPMLDGVSAVKAILANQKVPIVMFSSLTYEGARITLDALEAGAVDFISKNFSEISQNSSRLKRHLHETLLTFAKQFKQQSAPASPKVPEANAPSASVSSGLTQNGAAQSAAAAQPAEPAKPTSSARASQARAQGRGAIVSAPPSAKGAVCRPNAAKLLIIGASTGGPVAVHQVLDALPVNFPLPIIVVQHMPPNFTRALAERLNRVCALSVSEAVSGDRLKPGHVLVAPGGKQLIIDPKEKGCVKLMDGDDRMSYKPSVDIAFVSAANVFERQLHGIVLTGMGADGCEGAKILKQKGGTLWSQDQASCVVYGMPKAVVDAGLSDHVMPPSDMGAALIRGS
ncbi:protein-glutamate methylesterase/protein-glutamine glutaminase [Marinagarivorans cellulosilyticus]|uniref:Protein-glutamate methylesterase/protein-glutamine glutaminase n=1 Tax=Marinagarivorans cellulosilyticus TaxID=2721545 RepID=A0AAN1WKB4_9GAMM|nr:chemotaxis response regulator protein-glutamate methylesterase [Marinagarivorans cellulosilyticus]BCD99175.1 two-component system, chemotaxis family, protein-glutamate methylesterase/glutaminase [Marinagarivorans cellulosilyticus]